MLQALPACGRVKRSGSLPAAEAVPTVVGRRRRPEIGILTSVTPAPYTSSLAASLAPSLLERFQGYAQIDTQSRRDRSGSPSTPGQLELGRRLVGELVEAGLVDAALDPNGYVTATLPGSAGSEPVIGLIAHMDTSPDAPGADVQPVVHRDYDGAVIELPRGGTRLDPERMPELVAKGGHDIVTSSGDTLLGADDKAGVAEIVTAVAHLAAHPELPRPTLRVAFTPDEEIGEGATLFDIPRFGALCAYTMDGSEVGEVQDETFSARRPASSSTRCGWPRTWWPSSRRRRWRPRRPRAGRDSSIPTRSAATQGWPRSARSSVTSTTDCCASTWSCFSAPRGPWPRASLGPG